MDTTICGGKRVKFSLLTLLGAVAIAAVGCAALTHPTEAWKSATFTAALLLLWIAVIAALFCKVPTRGFWTGFAIGGWTYLLLVWGCLEGEVAPPHAGIGTTNVGRSLATTSALDALTRVMWAEPPTVQINYGGLLNNTTTAAAVGYSERWHRLLHIGHTLWALLFALAGGALTRVLQKSP